MKNAGEEDDDYPGWGTHTLETPTEIRIIWNSPHEEGLGTLSIISSFNLLVLGEDEVVIGLFRRSLGTVSWSLFCRDACTSAWTPRLRLSSK